MNYPLIPSKVQDMYRVNIDKAKEIAFVPYNKIEYKKIWYKNYDRVCSGNLHSYPDIFCLADLLKKYNSNDSHIKLSVSDVVVIADRENKTTKAYFRDSVGWKRICIEDFFRVAYNERISYYFSDAEYIEEIKDVEI